MTKPLRISWSALRAHGDCHQRSYLIREGRRAKVSNIRNFWPGTVVDGIMRTWLDLPANSVRPPMAELVAQAMDRSLVEEKSRGNIVRFRDAEDRNEVRKFCIELVTRLEPLLTKHVLPYPYECGKWFKVPMSLPDAAGDPREVLLTGEMDLLVEGDTGPVVWDLKGTADNQYWRKVIGQLIFYDFAVWVGTGAKTHHVGLIQPMCDEQLLVFQVVDTDRADIMQRIQRYAHDVWADERACTDDSAACHWCDVRHACSKFQQPALDAFGDLAAGLRTAAGETV